MWKVKRPWIAKKIWKQRIKLEEPYHPVLRLTIRKYNNQHSMKLANGLAYIDQWERIKSSEIDQHKCVQLNFGKVKKRLSGKRYSSNK